MHVQTGIIARFSHHVAMCKYIISNLAACMHSEHDDNVNTLAFVNFLLIKNFPTLIRQNFAPYGILQRRTKIAIFPVPFKSLLRTLATVKYIGILRYTGA